MLLTKNNYYWLEYNCIHCVIDYLDQFNQHECNADNVLKSLKFLLQRCINWRANNQYALFLLTSCLFRSFSKSFLYWTNTESQRFTYIALIKLNFVWDFQLRSAGISTMFSFLSVQISVKSKSLLEICKCSVCCHNTIVWLPWFICSM